MDRNAQIQESRNQQEKSNAKYERAVAEKLATRLELRQLESNKVRLEHEYADSLARVSTLSSKIAVSCRIGEYDKSRKYSYQHKGARNTLVATRKALLETELKFKEVTESYKFAKEMLKIAKDEVAASYQKAAALKAEIDDENAKKAEKIRQLAAYAKVPDDKLDSAYVKLEQDGNFGVYFDNTDEDGQEITSCHVVTPIGLIFKRDTQTQELLII